MQIYDTGVSIALPWLPQGLNGSILPLLGGCVNSTDTDSLADKWTFHQNDPTVGVEPPTSQY